MGCDLRAIGINLETFRRQQIHAESCNILADCTEPQHAIYVGYSESKYRLRISLAHPRDCHFAHVQ